MNIHFVSFLLDVLVWSILGVVVGYIFYLIERNTNLFKTALTFLIVSVLIGLFAVFSMGLPDFGIAVKDFIFVSTLVLIYAVITSSRLRLTITKHSKSAKRDYPLSVPLIKK